MVPIREATHWVMEWTSSRLAPLLASAPAILYTNTVPANPLSVHRSVPWFPSILSENIPPSNYLSLGLPDSDIVTDNDKLGSVSFVRMLCGILFFGKSEVQDIARVIPTMRFSVRLESMGESDLT